PQGGWRDAVAHPGGKLEYEGKTYSELFYESQVDRVAEPTAGIVIASADLENQLREITTQLGLMQTEQDEFISNWMPKLSALHAPYILFSLIDPAEKERIDHIDIS